MPERVEASRRKKEVEEEASMELVEKIVETEKEISLRPKYKRKTTIHYRRKPVRQL